MDFKTFFHAIKDDDERVLARTNTPPEKNSPNEEDAHQREGYGFQERLHLQVFSPANVIFTESVGGGHVDPHPAFSDDKPQTRNSIHLSCDTPGGCATHSKCECVAGSGGSFIENHLIA